MIKKEVEREKAIEMRRQGNTYSEILAKIPVAKSTLSLWLHEVGIARHQRQKFTEKKRIASLRGGEAKKKQRIEKQSNIVAHAMGDIGELSKRELFLIGVALYWAEGSKQKEHNVSEQVIFGNSDPYMIELFLYWLRVIKIAEKDISFQLYIHKDAQFERAVIFWSKIIKKAPEVLKGKVYFKKGNRSSFRKNKGEKYYGLLRIRVSRSTELNRKIEGWVKGIVGNLKI